MISKILEAVCATKVKALIKQYPSVLDLITALQEKDLTIETPVTLSKSVGLSKDERVLFQLVMTLEEQE